MAERAVYLPLFAKAQLVVGTLAFIALLVLYPQRKKEADAYARSPVCADGTTDLTGCRRLVTAEVVRVKCPEAYKGLESCEIALRVQGSPAFINLLREPSAQLKPGSPLRVEMMGGIPTAAELDGKLVRGYGSPDMAMEKMRLMALINVILTAAAAAYLWQRRRQTATSA